MEYRRLGKTGIKVSVLSYGSWVSFHNQVSINQVKDIFKAARGAGVNFFDTAEIYAKGQAEVLTGQALKELGWKRSDIVLSTKLFFGDGGEGPNDKGLSRKHIQEGIKASLSRLQTDYVDLLFCHRPDPNTPIEETVRAMNWCIDHGYTFYWGTSEWSAEQIQEAVDIAKELGLQPPQFEQPEYNLFARQKVEADYLPLYDSRHGLGLTTWSPLASGILTGKYSGGQVPEGSRFAVEAYKGMFEKRVVEKRQQIDQADQLTPIAQELGASLAQLSLAWCAANPHVSTVITGSTSVAQVEENMKAVELIPRLTPEIMDRIEKVVGTKPKL